MDVHAACRAHRRQAPVLGQAALVKGMAGFMQDAHQAGGEIVFVVASGDAEIIRGAAGKRVRRDIQPAAFEIKAEGRHEAHANLALGCERERAFG